MTETPKPPIPDHGVPPEAHNADSKGMPSSDREQTEKAVGKIDQDADQTDPANAI